MIPFLIIFNGIFISAHIYLYLHLRSALPRGKSRGGAAALMALLFGAFLLAGLGRRFLPFDFSAAAWRLGVWWFGFLFYAVFVLLLVDIARAIIWAVRRLGPGLRNTGFPALRREGLLAVLMGVILLLFAGYLNARRPRLVEREIRLAPSCGPVESLDLMLVSDLHLGTMVNRRILRRVVGEVEALRPDLIVLVGDIVDRDARSLEDPRVQELLARFRAPLGVYAVTGNHEFITGVEKAVAGLSRSGIVFLRDRTVKVGGSFYLAGREDVSGPRWGGSPLPLGEVLEGIDRRCPVIVLDHQPRRIGEAAAEGADLVLSGHTHHGQLFPLNLITSAIYPVSRGYGTMGETKIYVSSGAGTWGPPVRIGNTPEIVLLRIQFE